MSNNINKTIDLFQGSLITEIVHHFATRAVAFASLMTFCLQAALDWNQLICVVWSLDQVPRTHSSLLISTVIQIERRFSCLLAFVSECL